MIVWSSVLAFAITFIFMPFLIAYFRAKKEGQMIRTAGPKWHNSKSGTPTMGGILFILAGIISSLVIGLISHQLTVQVIVAMAVFLGYGLIGSFDDSIKIFKHQNEGFKAWQKALLQTLGAIIIFVVLLNVPAFPMYIASIFGIWHLGWWYLLFIIIWMVGWSNAVNLTDGLDGLVSGISIIGYLAFGIVAVNSKNFDVAIFNFSIVGALIAFLWFNKKPAKIFMGDTGSLALGAGLAMDSILLHMEFGLLAIGIIPIIETLSVILQVGSWKLFHRRIFKMSPIHHHFEMSGWSEWKIDIVFWIITLLGSALAVYMYI
ncbi:phospho-N-acetylmuramoyl-pentapeptide-transferase [Periweissella cryptocerci]|uniref:Phospho-N-acetylmuramoyl-pentapeptide-transferase n=2 Tax=Periweissella cryptocerci TaxID=2506420 RepID=A0A4V1AJ16_9LACO|nr:phospho-N-acetylmuramoyl-pentapeptide-transferase [Periweissella cryptocerci]